MDEMIFEGVTSYYNALEKLGYMSYGNMQRLLILIFYRDFVYNDYRANLSEEDYYTIEKALDCLYGTTCLIPYPDYLKMGKLHLGEVTEMARRLDTLEHVRVLKLTDVMDACTGDISIVSCPDYMEPAAPPPPKKPSKKKKHSCR